MNFKNVYAGIMTRDIETAKEWYGKLFGRKSDYNPMEILHEWNFSNGGVLQLVEDKERAGYSSITIMVSDIGEVNKELVEKKISQTEKYLKAKSLQRLRLMTLKVTG